MDPKPCASLGTTVQLELRRPLSIHAPLVEPRICRWSFQSHFCCDQVPTAPTQEWWIIPVAPTALWATTVRCRISKQPAPRAHTIRTLEWGYLVHVRHASLAGPALFKVYQISTTHSFHLMNSLRDVGNEHEVLTGVLLPLRHKHVHRVPMPCRNLHRCVQPHQVE